MARLKDFRVIVLSLLLGLGLAHQNGFAGEKSTTQPVQSLSVFDSNGKRVGSVLGFAGSNELPTVGLRVDGRLIVLKVERDKFSQSGFTAEYSTLYFESSNCTGTPFIPGTAAPLPAPFNILDGTKLYAFEGPQRDLIIRSTGSTSLPNIPCEPVNSVPGFMQPLRFLTDLAEHFQPPFTLR